jgi:hypothetical protein
MLLVLIYDGENSDTYCTHTYIIKKIKWIAVEIRVTSLTVATRDIQLFCSLRT